MSGVSPAARLAFSCQPERPLQKATLAAYRWYELFGSVGLVDIEESTLRVSSTYTGFDELWSGFLAGVGPAGAFCSSLDDDTRRRLRDSLYRRLGSPAGSFTLAAVARCSVGKVPG